MANLGTAYVQIVPSAQGITGSISKTIAPEAGAAGITAGKGIATNISSTLKSVGGNMLKAGGIATALSLPLIASVKNSMAAYNLQNQAETKLTEIYKTRMGVSDQAAKKTIELASALQKQGVVGDEVALAGAQQLATFAKMPDTVNTLLPAMNNLLVQQKGLNGTQQDATQIANLMGKVMMGQTGALKRVGISFDENQEKVLKYGTEQEKAAMLSQVITENVGNMNKAFAETNEGKMQQMNNALGDLKEKLGGAIAPALGQLANFISEKIFPKVEGLLNMLAGSPVLGKVVLAITGILAVGGPLLVVLGAIVSAVGALIPVFGAISAPIVGIVAGIGALVAALVIAYQRSETFRNALQNAGSAIASAVAPVIKMLQGKIQELMPVLMSLITTIGTGLGQAINFVTPILTLLIDLFGKGLSVALNVIITVFKKVTAAFKVVGKVMGPPVQKAGAVVTGACKKIADALTFKNVVSKVTGVFRSVRTKITDALKTARETVNNVVKRIKTFMGFSGLAGKVSSTFRSIKEKITQPIDSAKGIVQRVVDKIKGFFPLKIGKIFSGLKLPHFSVSGGSFPWGVGGKGSLPHWKVSWYKKAMDEPYMFSRPTLIGAGEAGDEIMYGRQNLMRDIKDAVGSGGDTVINLNYNASDDARTMLRDVARELRRYKMAGAI